MTRSKVIAHIISSNFFGGPERQVLTHAEHLRRQGLEPLIISFRDSEGVCQIIDRARDSGIATVVLPCCSSFDPGVVASLARVLRERNVSLLVSHGYKSNVIGRLACWLLRLPKLAVSRGWTGENIKIRLYEKLDRRFLGLADAVVAVSRGQRDKILACGVRPDKVLVIHNAIDPAFASPTSPQTSERRRLGIPRDALCFGTAGRLSPEKNHEGFIRAASLVLRERPDTHFVIWGEGVLKPTLEGLVRELGLEDRLHLAGFVANVRSHFHELDVFVLPSHTEGLSNVLLEACAASRPAVATEVGGNPEVVIHGETGLLAPAANSQALAQAMLDLAADPHRREAMGAAGRARVEAEFTFEAQTRQYLCLYDRLLTGPTGQAAISATAPRDSSGAIRPSSRAEAGEERIFITVVMPVRNEVRFIAQTLKALLDQDYPSDRFEIIVADGLSDDGTGAIVREMSARHPNIRLEDNPARRSSSGRNIGFRRGRGDVFLVVDGHCHIPSRQLLSEVASCFERTEADCLGRPQHLDPPGLTSFQRTVALARASWLGHGGRSLIYGEEEGFLSPVSNGAAYRREVFDKIGYVDENFDACEDVEFNWRVEQAGLVSYTSPRLMLKYFPRESLGGLWRQMIRYGLGRFKLLRKHPGTLSAGTLVPPLFVLGLGICLTGLPLALGAGKASVAAVMALPPVSYVLLVAMQSLRLAGGRQGIQPLSFPTIYACIHLGLGVGFLRGLLERPGKERGQ